MKHKRLGFKAGKGGSTDWRHVFSTRRAQAAEMVIRPGDAEGGPDNRHQGADQWLFVISGAGEARINGRRTHLFTGSLLLIEQGAGMKSVIPDTNSCVPSTFTRRPPSGQMGPGCRAAERASQHASRQEGIAYRERVIGRRKACPTSQTPHRHPGSSRRPVP